MSPAKQYKIREIITYFFRHQIFTHATVDFSLTCIFYFLASESFYNRFEWQQDEYWIGENLNFISNLNHWTQTGSRELKWKWKWYWKVLNSLQQKDISNWKVLRVGIKERMNENWNRENISKWNKGGELTMNVFFFLNEWMNEWIVLLFQWERSSKFQFRRTFIRDWSLKIRRTSYLPILSEYFRFIKWIHAFSWQWQFTIRN